MLNFSWIKPDARIYPVPYRDGLGEIRWKCLWQGGRFAVWKFVFAPPVDREDDIITLEPYRFRILGWWEFDGLVMRDGWSVPLVKLWLWLATRCPILRCLMLPGREPAAPAERHFEFGSWVRLLPYDIVGKAIGKTYEESPETIIELGPGIKDNLVDWPDAMLEQVYEFKGLEHLVTTGHVDEEKA